MNRAALEVLFPSVQTILQSITEVSWLFKVNVQQHRHHDINAFPEFTALMAFWPHVLKFPHGVMLRKIIALAAW